MAKPMRGHLTPWPPEGAEEPETTLNVLQQERQIDAREGKAAVYYNPDIEYEPEEPGPYIKAINEDEENFDTEYAKMELP